MSRSVRIGCGAGYAGDRIEPAVDLIRDGQLDYIIFECLAERTIALAQQARRNDPASGYDSLLDERMRKVLPALHQQRVRMVSNMGAANPEAAAQRMADIAGGLGIGGMRVAAVVGDDILDKLPAIIGLPTMESGRALADLGGRIVSANAYIGAAAITEALADGADIVITGRAADPALVVGPLVHAFGRTFDDYEFLGQATVAGHLLECGTQASGGYFADPGYKDVDALWNVGYPIAEVDAGGDVLVSTLPGAGGAVTEATVKEQLLYELHDPARYLTPDVVADFSRLSVASVRDGVRVTGGSGHERTGSLKVSVGILDGYIGEGEISYGGSGARARAELAADIVRRRLEHVGVELAELRFDLVGVNSLYGSASRKAASGADPAEVRLRVAGRADTEEAAAAIGREVEALYTNGPAGGGGARRSLRECLAVESVLVPESLVETRVQYIET